MKKPQRLEQALGYDFRQPGLLRQALTHRSHSPLHNERLEFLGDSVLNCVVAELLYRRCPDAKEGDLSRLRANLVRQEFLAELANGIQLGEYLLLGEGERKSGGVNRPSILADAMEAVFGAILLDTGFDSAREVITRMYAPAMSDDGKARSGKDSKTALQELLQGRKLPLPRYGMLKTCGVAHAQEFEVECVIADLGICSIGVGSSRRAAEQRAAQRAIELMTAQPAVVAAVS